MTADLAPWLLEQIAADEEHASMAPSPGTSMWDGAKWVACMWSPARVLAECESKRRIIQWVQTWPWRKEPPSSVDGLLPMLAAPYADRPGYREEWKP